MRKESLDVFEDKSHRPLFLHYPRYFPHQSSPRVLKPFLVTLGTKRLTWETSKQHVMVGDNRRRNLRYISRWPLPEIGLVDIAGTSIYVGRKNTPPTEALRGDSKTPDPAKQINKRKHAQALSLKFFPLTTSSKPIFKNPDNEGLLLSDKNISSRVFSEFA